MCLGFVAVICSSVHVRIMCATHSFQCNDAGAERLTVLGRGRARVSGGRARVHHGRRFYSLGMSRDGIPTSCISWGVSAFSSNTFLTTNRARSSGPGTRRAALRRVVNVAAFFDAVVSCSSAL